MQWAWLRLGAGPPAQAEASGHGEARRGQQPIPARQCRRSRHGRGSTRLRVLQLLYCLLQGHRQPAHRGVCPECGALRRWHALARLRAAGGSRRARGAALVLLTAYADIMQQLMKP